MCELAAVIMARTEMIQIMIKELEAQHQSKKGCCRSMMFRNIKAIKGVYSSYKMMCIIRNLTFKAVDLYKKTLVDVSTDSKADEKADISVIKVSPFICPGIPSTIKTMGVNITTIVYLRVSIIQIGSTIILMVLEA